MNSNKKTARIVGALFYNEIFLAIWLIVKGFDPTATDPQGSELGIK